MATRKGEARSWCPVPYFILFFLRSPSIIKVNKIGKNMHEMGIGLGGDILSFSNR